MQVLRYGDSGLIVRYLQLALCRTGLPGIEPDGLFGRRTLQAAEQFQTQKGLTPDGVVGERTWTALYPYLTGYTVHVVRPGDTYFRLAREYDTTAQAIETANPALVPTNLQVGLSLIVPLGFDVVTDQVPYSYTLTQLIAEGLRRRYPFIGKRSVGASVMGREIVCLIMGAGQTQLSFNASHHANEWITTPLTLRFLEDYAKAFATGGRIFDIDARTLFARTILFLMPLVNPDGVDLVTGAIPEEDSYYKQAQALSTFYPGIPFPSGWKANIRGVDLNLQYPAGWDEAQRFKYTQGFTRPGPRDFVGLAPLTEPESRAMYDFTLSRRFALTLAYHTQGEVIFWKYRDYEPPRSYEIAQAFAGASGYAVEETPLGSGNAGYKDWFIQTYNLPGYTIEAGLGESPLPLTDLPKMYADNVGIMALALRMA